MMSAQRVGVLGGGLMGHGIALVFAVAGYDVVLTDPIAAVRGQVRERIAATLAELGHPLAALDRVTVVQTLEECVAGAQWVIEAAPEDLALKQRIFADVERAAPPEAILASNTSVIPIGQIMTNVDRKHRAIGTHWWNPPYLVPLVEVIRTADTSDATVTATLEMLRSVGKSPVEVKKDVPGFVGNRLQHALWREAIALVAEGVCDARTVDDVVKSSFGARLAVLGPIENADLVGLDLTRAIHSYVFPTLDRATAPSPLLERLIADGRLGFKSGEGFSTWTEEQQAAVRSRLSRHLKASFGAAENERE
ncbi:3-hydroxybutyryl-CoA dehydrogenase [Bradyrhizobium sp. USDA 3397]